MSRMRLIHLRIEPVLVIDDGDEFSPGPQLETVSVTPSQLGDYVARLREFINQLNETKTDLPKGT